MQTLHPCAYVKTSAAHSRYTQPARRSFSEVGGERDRGNNMCLTDLEVSLFQAMIWGFYREYGRSFAWRAIDNPYYVMISEIMLQQTQTDRVVAKYEQFIEAFPTIAHLASADLREVLGVWQGLGYNRRGKALWDNARNIVQNFSGIVPEDPAILETFASIGPNTAGSIVAFAFNKPVVFIETNIRTVYLHTFFKGQQEVRDKQLMPLIEQTLDHTNPREWYYALMDYGVHLKKLFVNPSRASAHYAVQSKFQGSDRQIRGRIIKELALSGATSKQQLFAKLGDDYERYERIIHTLVSDALVRIEGELVFI